VLTHGVSQEEEASLSLSLLFLLASLGKAALIGAESILQREGVGRAGTELEGLFPPILIEIYLLVIIRRLYLKESIDLSDRSCECSKIT
jgi:hypothetical protein